jgi:type I restriction enzyme R subunit
VPVQEGRAGSFEEMLGKALSRDQNRGIDAAQVIEEDIELARQMQKANARSEALGLNEEEVAFYDALEINDSAVMVLRVRPFAPSRRSS